MRRKKGAKGKAQPAGRAGQKQKQKARSSKQKGSASLPYFVGDEDGDVGESSKTTFKGFAQGRMEAMQSAASPNVRLRHRTIAFVAATPVIGTPGDSESERMVIDTRGSNVDEDDSENESAEITQVDALAGPAAQDLDDGELITNIMEDMREDVRQDLREDVLADAMHEAMNDKPATHMQLDSPDVTLAEMSLERQAAASPTLSDSSEDIVIFHGRNAKPVILPSSAIPARALATVDRHVTDDLLEALAAQTAPRTAAASTTTVSPTPQFPAAIESEPEASSSFARGWAARPPKWQAEERPADQWTPAPSQPYWKKGRSRPDLDPQPAERAQISDAPARQSKVMFAEPPKAENGAEESIASLQEDWKRTLRDKRLTRTGVLGVESVPNGKSPVRRGKRGRQQGSRASRYLLVSDDDDDDDDGAGTEAAYDDYMANLASQLDDNDAAAAAQGTELAAGPSLVFNGKAIAEDEILTKDFQVNDDDDNDDSESDSDSDNVPIGQDLSDLSDDPRVNLSDLDSTDLEDELVYTEQEQWADEEDLRQRRKDRMADEHIARLYAKQIELGIDDNELVIDDGLFYDNAEGVGNVDEAIVGLSRLINTPSSRATKKHGMRRRASHEAVFPDASALADVVEQYGDDTAFDIMDRSRPSLGTAPKGRKGKGLAPSALDDLSDEELKDQMQASWARDRATKRARKAEREALRAEGLLGVRKYDDEDNSSSSAKADLSIKYPQGMTYKQIVSEIDLFLRDSRANSRAFPPMEKHDRKALHEVAGELGLKSKSVGTGRKRFPVLIKTARSRGFVDEETLSARLLSGGGMRRSGFLKNARGGGGFGSKVWTRGGKTGPAGARGGSASMAAAGLRHGEVVGAGAAELGKENLGHKLMEKMGWSKGMALGKDGEGLLVPVAQVMRSGKAGLG